MAAHEMLRSVLRCHEMLLPLVLLHGRQRDAKHAGGDLDDRQAGAGELVQGAAVDAPPLADFGNRQELALLVRHAHLACTSGVQ